MLNLVLNHTQDEELQGKIKAMFNTAAPPSNMEKKFMNELSNGNYSKCEELLPEIVNPFSLKISLPEVKGLL